MDATALSTIRTSADYAANAVPANTQRAYALALSQFLAAGYTIPANEAEIVAYLTERANSGVRLSTLEMARAAIGKAHTTRNLPNPCQNVAVRHFMRGVVRTLAREGRAVKRGKAALGKNELRVALPIGDSLAAKRNRALLLVEFFSGSRVSEIVGLDVEDVRLESDALTLHIRQTKTSDTGITKRLPTVGGELCPVGAMRAYLADAGIESGALFRQVKSRKPNELGGHRLTADGARTVLKAALKKAGLDWRAYSTHSLRAGLVTTALADGASITDVMKLTGHASADTVAKYSRDTERGQERVVRIAAGAGDD